MSNEIMQVVKITYLSSNGSEKEAVFTGQFQVDESDFQTLTGISFMEQELPDDCSFHDLYEELTDE